MYRIIFINNNRLNGNRNPITKPVIKQGLNKMIIQENEIYIIKVITDISISNNFLIGIIILYHCEVFIDCLNDLLGVLTKS